jgi:hypothetical protein
MDLDIDIEGWLSGNLGLGVALVAVIGVIAWANRYFVRDVAADPDREWRVMARLGALVTTVFILWTTLFDNWRQLIGFPYRSVQRFPSKRVEIDPTPESIRTVTWVLLALALVTVACLFARHIGGYGLQGVLLIGAIVFWGPLFALRQRLDLNLALGFDGDPTSIRDVGGYALHLLVTWAFDISVIVASFGVLLGVVALPITLLLDLLRRRQPRTSGEAATFFSSIGERAGSATRQG